MVNRKRPNIRTTIDPKNMDAIEARAKRENLTLSRSLDLIIHEWKKGIEKEPLYDPKLPKLSNIEQKLQSIGKLSDEIIEKLKRESL